MKIRVVTALAGLLALGACSTPVVYDGVGPRADYFDGDFEYAANKGAIVTPIVGNPFDIPDRQFQARVRALMRGQNQGVPADFVAAPDGRTILPFKVVAAFNPDRAVSGDDLCAGHVAQAAKSRPGLVRVKMAFCYGDQLKSESAGVVAGVAGPDDPNFAALVRRVTLALIPPQDNEETGQGRKLRYD